MNTDPHDISAQTSSSRAVSDHRRHHVTVVGGGVIGLSSAYQLARAGVDVTLIERNLCGHGASWGNAGWIVPSLVQPFNTPGAVPQALRAMTDTRSPIALRQLPTWKLARWGLQFLRASRPDRSHASLHTLAAMARGAAAEITSLADQLGFATYTTGLLVPFRSTAARSAYQASLADVVEAGYQGRVEVLDTAAVRSREPALSDDVVGGLHLLDEISVRPDAMASALARGVPSAGGELAENETVRNIAPHTSGRWRVATDRRVLETDAVVVAAGEHSAQLLRKCGVALQLQSGRGCSITLPPVVELGQALKIAEHRVACTPFADGHIRISGTFDLVRLDAGTAKGRMRSVLERASTYLPALRELDTSHMSVWSGARPCTPDSVPVVGPVGATRGLFVATGHGTLGMTLAAATGRIITSLVTQTVAQGINPTSICLSTNSSRSTTAARATSSGQPSKGTTSQ